VRDVGAFLSRGEAQWRYGAEQVPTAVAALAWELIAHAQVLRAGILRALRDHDWDWLGLR
jgi:hypothetical protein